MAKTRILLLLGASSAEALAKALGPGERWITVHPHGKDDKGTPVLIQQQPDGSAKVIGGAGGKLNHLRLTGVKRESDYSAALKERAAERRAAHKRQAERDRALGLQQSKAAAHKQITERTKEAQREYVAGVAAAMGWEPDAYRFNPDEHADKDNETIARLADGHLREMVRRADEAVRLNRERILADADYRAAADLGDIPLRSPSAAVLGVEDLDPVKASSTGLGFATDYRGRAEARGADVAVEAEQFKADLTPDQRRAALRNGETATLVRENIELLREPDKAAALAPKLVEASQALKIMKLEKRRKLAERQAKDARRKVNDAIEAPKAYVLEIDDAKVDAKVAEEVANDLRTISTRGFLAEATKVAPDAPERLRRHVGAGAFNSINALALAAGGAALVDRSVVDVLGVAGAAEVLSRRLAADLTPEELRDVADGMEDYHLHHYMAASEEALGRARELKAQAAELELGAAEHGDDLAALQEINKRRGEAIAEAEKVLGTALGEMEANAALVYALRRDPSSKPFQVPLGGISVESAVAQARAIGLQRGDYSLETVAGNRVLTVAPEGLDRLAAPVSRDDLQQVRRNLAIISGEDDEDGWLPMGVTDRPDLDLRPQPGVAPSFAVPFAPGADLEQSVRDYIGARAADGDPPADIVADLQSSDFMRKVGADRAGAYREILDRVAPLQDADGKLKQADALRPTFEAMADAHVEARYGGERAPLHRQSLQVDDVAVEALHRALAAHPVGIAAFKPVGDLTPQDQRALRNHFAKHVSSESEDAAAARVELEQVSRKEPDREVTDLFGDTATNPDWTAWRARRDELQQRIAAGGTDWPSYVKAMRGPANAYAAMQDVVRSSVTKAFADAHNTLRPAAPIKVGRTTIHENLAHLDAVDPAARERRRASERALADGLRERVQGRYAGGSVRDKLDAAREEEAGLAAAQMSFFAAEPEAVERALGADERHTIGHVAERQLAALVPRLAGAFRPGEPVKLFRPSMSGGKNVARQRAIKLLAANKRIALSFGTGAGKTLIGLAGFSHLHEAGTVKRGLFLVPSIAQEGFNGEAARFLAPGKFKWHAQAGASRDERIAAYKDPSTHFAVMTHQSFRDDMLHLAAQHAGVSEAEMAGQIASMSRSDRASWMRETMRREGISFDYLNVDEGHGLLNRKGKENSALANVVDGLADHTPYYVNATADPVKNDVSEAFSLLQKMDPARYTDEAEFMRKYGADTLSAKDGLRRELARFQYPSKIDPDITATRVESKVAPSAGQQAALASLDRDLASARVARMSGGVDVAALRRISPGSFEGVEAEQHEAVARELSDSIGLLKQTAVKQILDAHPENGKIEALVEAARQRTGKPGVVFAHSLAAVEAIRARLGAEGYRVATITGKDSAKDKGARIRGFNPQAGDRETDILVCSDAGATGANLQSGQWLANFDTPDTAMTHAQRNGRINRVGQTNDVDLIDLVIDHPEEHKRRDRLTKKYALREMLTTPMESLDDTGVAFFLRQRQLERESMAA